MRGVELFDDVRGGGVDGIGDDDNGSHDGHGDVEKLQVVAVNDFAHLFARLHVDEHVISAFSQGHKERQQKSHHHNPV